tara:strand:+ start:853 stop:1089 length:237 start_codon:yes stop_codon:yes gene_type:complete
MDKEEFDLWIEKILGYKTWSDKRKIDTFLEYDCNMYTNLGMDSLKSERLDVRRKSKLLYKAIAKVDESMGKKFLHFMD